MTGTWRAYVGEWPRTPDMHTPPVDEAGLSWDTARQRLLDFAHEGVADDCPSCAARAVRCVTELSALQPGTAWSGSIDWDDLILAEDKP